MKTNKVQTQMTVLTNAVKAGQTAKQLEKENRLASMIRYKNYKKNIIEFYIFYYAYKL